MADRKEVAEKEDEEERLACLLEKSFLSIYFSFSTPGTALWWKLYRSKKHQAACTSQHLRTGYTHMIGDKNKHGVHMWKAYTDSFTSYMSEAVSKLIKHVRHFVQS